MEIGKLLKYIFLVGLIGKTSFEMSSPMVFKIRELNKFLHRLEYIYCVNGLPH